MIAALARHLIAARQRSLLDTLAIGWPIVMALGAVAGRLAGVGPACIVMVAAALILSGIAWRRARRFDQAWLVQVLDARVPAFEDSSALLLRGSVGLQGLAALQQQRLLDRLAGAAALDLRPAWSWRWIASAVGASLVVSVTAAVWPRQNQTGPGGESAPSWPLPEKPRLVGVRLRVTPPAYTGQRPFDQTGLDVRAPAGSTIEWILSLRPEPASVNLSFPGQAPMNLAPTDQKWAGSRRFTASALYRLEASGLPRQRLHQLEMIADLPPTVRMLTPDRTLNLASADQAHWDLSFEARDDYGVANSAMLRLTVTRGEGEMITTTERSLPLTGQGTMRLKRFSTRLDLARERLEPGNDLIAQLVVWDNRSPSPQVVEGPAVILRQPQPGGLSDGLDGMARQILPVYFRSQRQIIIDAEALIAQRARTAPDVFLERSNALGSDQAQLRLRYGQFMGEEAEGGGPGLAIPTNDTPTLDLPTNDGPPPAAATQPEPHHGHSADDGHDHGSDTTTFGQMGDVVAQFGHAHDTGDASTLFDPGTRSTLAQALDAMWASERALRQGRPKEALPHALKALSLLKTAQQATRIYLARTPPRIPPIDLSRRLSGKRDGIRPGRFATTTRAPDDTPAMKAWQALGQTGKSSALPLDELARWVVNHQGRLADPLALSAQIDTVRNEPNCLECRQKLRALLWTALERPPVGVLRRSPADAGGQRYLDALR